jgi:glucosamine--fructose-6-phosphate aminotransferase (isomerizing)
LPKRRTQHPYWIWESMESTPEMLESCLVQPISEAVERVAGRLVELGIDRVFCAGTGSSGYAGILHALALQELAGLRASWHVSSDLSAYPPPDMATGSALILTSHSGRTLGDLHLVELARGRSALTIGITDIADSPLAQAVDDTIIGPGGPKPELPATRTYVAAMFRVLQLAAAVGRLSNSPRLASGFEEQLRAVPGSMRSFFSAFAAQAADWVAALSGVRRYFTLAAGPNMSTACEGALVFLQSTDAGAQAFQVEEMLHGPIQALRNDMCVVAIAAPGPRQDRILQTAQASALIGARVVILAPQDVTISPGAGMRIDMPAGIVELLTPLLYIVPLWLIGYEFALATGRDPDNLSRDRPEFRQAFRLLMAGDPRFTGQ